MKDNALVVWLVVACALFGAFLIYVGANMEAATFNKFSEKQATWVDALSIELRVEACK